MRATPGARIRFATAQDCEAIHALILALADYEKLRHTVVATAADLRAQLFAERPAAEVLLVETAQGCVGFALFFHNYSTFVGRRGLYLEDLFVLPAHRGHGYGKALMVRLAQLARERDCGRFEWSVLDWNEPSIAFYRSIGAVTLDEWIGHRLTRDAIERLAAQQLRCSID